jgi:serine phosphatase RsbU (regulator of sigma subunit)/HAMP domain-containing protein
LLIVGCILFTGSLIATLFALQFRREMLLQERSSSFTVYQATINYLSGHYYSKRENFVPRSLDFVFSNRFLVVEAGAPLAVTHRPSRITVLDAGAAPVYTFDREGGRTPLEAPTGGNPGEVLIEVQAGRNRILAYGPIDAEGAVPGSVVIELPTDLAARLHRLYRRSALALFGGVLLASVIGYIISRRFLAPVEALTAAARRVHDGDYACRIDHVQHDEIGLLTSTFNEMVASWSRRLTLMHRIQQWTLQVGNEFDRHRLYSRLLDMFQNVANCRQCALYLRDGDRKTLQPAAVFGDDPVRPELGQRIRFVLEKGEPVLAERTDAAAGMLMGKVCELVLPLTSGDHPIGAVYIGPPGEHEAYDGEMVATLQTLAQHAGIAVENARLLNEVAEKDRIEQEMNWARDIQRTLLPRTPPEVPGYALHGISLPANEVGGDYFDFILRPDGRCQIMVSDVSGKGVAAGLIMSVLRSLVHTYSEFEDCPREILTRVNRVLTRDLDESMFVTAAMMTLNPVEHQVRLARAGHEPLLVVGADGAVRWFKPAGTALGLLDVGSFEAHFEVLEVPLHPGDTAVLYTDGVNEAQNPAGEEFGLENLVRVVVAHRSAPLPEMVAALLDEVRRYARGRHQSDDITLIAVRREG